MGHLQHHQAPTHTSHALHIMANVENPEIQQAYEDVRNDSTGYNWFILGYENNTTIKVDGKGKGGVAEGVSHFKENEVQYGFFKVSFVANDETKRTSALTPPVTTGSSLATRTTRPSRSMARAICK